MAVEIGNWNRGGASPRLTLVTPRQAGGGWLAWLAVRRTLGRWTTLLVDTTWVMGLRSIEARIARAGQAMGMHIMNASCLPACLPCQLV